MDKNPSDTLISSFTQTYDIEGIKFQGDIACCAHVLNIITQDILRVIIQNDWDLAQDIDVIRSIELEDNQVIDMSSKYYSINFIKIILLIFYIRYLEKNLINYYIA
jgi:hypothetical protein